MWRQEGEGRGELRQGNGVRKTDDPKNGVCELGFFHASIELEVAKTRTLDLTGEKNGIDLHDNRNAMNSVSFIEPKVSCVGRKLILPVFMVF
jgi:hypothetical protein